MTTGAANPGESQQRDDVEAVLPGVTASLRRSQRPRAVRRHEARRPGRWVTNAQVGPWWLVLYGLARQAAWATEADRGRAALLATVSHDLRAPLAAATAAVSGLRLRDARLTAEDREELLAAAEESLDLLAHLAASLLDVRESETGCRAMRRGLPLVFTGCAMPR